MTTRDFHRPVTLKTDQEFRGYVYAAYEDDDGNLTGKLAVDVSKPDRTKLRGCVAIEQDRLEFLPHVTR